MTSDWMFWIAGGVLGIAGLWLAYWALLFDRAKGRKRCPKCWYDMQGAESLRCPECGHTAKRERKLRKTRRRWRWAFLSVVLLLSATSLGLTPRVREGGLASVTPTTALILIQRYREDSWAYEGLQHRIAVRQPDGSAEYPASQMYQWQWRMLAKTCLQNIRDTDDGDLAQLATYLLVIASRSGIEPPADAAATLAERIKNPAAWGFRFTRYLWEDELGSWLADQYQEIEETTLARLRETKDSNEAYHLLPLLVQRKGDDGLVEKLLGIVPQMSDASSVDEVFEAIVSDLSRAAWSGQKADERIVKALIAILSCRFEHARYDAALLLASPEVVDPQLALRALELAIDSGDRDDDLRMVRTTVSLINTFEEDGLTDESDSEDPAVTARFLSSIASVDFDMAMFVIRRDLEGNSPYVKDLLIDALINEKEHTELALRFLKQLALDEQPEIRRMVPSRAGQMASHDAGAMSILMTLSEDTSGEVRSEAERALERIRTADEDSP